MTTFNGMNRIYMGFGANTTGLLEGRIKTMNALEKWI